MSDLATASRPALLARPDPTLLVTIRGADVRGIRPHWRGPGHLRTVELVLEGGDVVLLDPFALRLLAEAQIRLAPQ